MFSVAPLKSKKELTEGTKKIYNGCNDSFQRNVRKMKAVTLAESTVKDNARLFADISEVPRKAFTMGIKQIMQAKRILILASGKNKADAVYKTVYGAVTEEVPASVLQLHPSCILIADREAASKL